MADPAVSTPSAAVVDQALISAPSRQEHQRLTGQLRKMVPLAASGAATGQS